MTTEYDPIPDPPADIDPALQEADRTVDAELQSAMESSLDKTIRLIEQKCDLRCALITIESALKSDWSSKDWMVEFIQRILEKTK